VFRIVGVGVGLLVNVFVIIVNIDLVGKCVGGIFDLFVGLLENAAQLIIGIVGFLVGTLVGFLLGITVGVIVGTLVGFLLGITVGVLVGTLVGRVLGIIVGLLVNLTLGLLVIGDLVIIVVGLRVLNIGFLKEDLLTRLEGL
jgi:hypothetical protein